MAPTLPDTPALRQLEGALASDAVYLVNEHAQRVTFLDSLHVRCWAHLRDVVDGQEYVHELKGSRDLLEPRYQEMLGLENFQR